MGCRHTLQYSVNMNTVNLIILAVCMAIARAEVEPRIIGGQNAEDGQFPYQVSLRTKLSNKHFCGGSIISSRFILTAAHCSEGITSKPLFVFAAIGSVRRNSIPGMKVGTEAHLSMTFR